MVFVDWVQGIGFLISEGVGVFFGFVLEIVIA